MPGKLAYQTGTLPSRVYGKKASHLRPPLRVSCRSSRSRSDAWLPLPGAPSSSSRGVVGRLFSWSVLVERDARDALYVPSAVVGDVLRRVALGSATWLWVSGCLGVADHR